MKPPYDISNARETLTCYSGLYASVADVYAPADVDELRRVLAWARTCRRRVTFRAGGHSFDGQALGDDVVVSLAAMTSIEVLPGAGPKNRPRLRVGPGAKWGAILAAVEPLGYVPAITVTTEHATAGGTLSGDCLSRFSPAYGKEGTWIASFELLTMDGRLLHCVPPRTGVPFAELPLEEQAFCGVIGGLGYLGAVVSITYDLLPVGQTNAQIGVATTVRKFRTFRDLAKDLVPTAKQIERERSDPEDETKLDAIYSALFVGPKREPYALLFKSHFTKDPDRRRMAVHQPELGMRTLVEWLMRIDLVSQLAWPVFFEHVYRDGERYIDDLEGFTFFMDGNARAKAIAGRLGFHLKTVQQTFIVPSAPGAAGGWDESEDDLVEWLEYAADLFRSRGLHPTLHDVLYLPADARFLMSATADLAGFAVSYAFETSDAEKIEEVKKTFSEMADTLWAKFSGRVYLVKNVCAKEETLRAMYGANAEDFFALKRSVDPDLVLRNDFLERTFGDFLASPSPKVVRPGDAA